MVYLKIIVLSLTVIVTGCSQHFVRDMVGSRMVSFNKDFASPWLLASQDTDLMCGMGEGMAAMTYPMGPNVNQLIPM